MIQQGFGGNKHKNGQLQSGYSPENQMFIYIYMFSAGFTSKSYGFNPSPALRHRHRLRDQGIKGVEDALGPQMFRFPR
jgi:hypothetical protein